MKTFIAATVAAAALVLSTVAFAGYSDVQDMLNAQATQDTKVTTQNSTGSANVTEREAADASGQ